MMLPMVHDVLNRVILILVGFSLGFIQNIYSESSEHFSVYEHWKEIA
jgi:hypothetical protein